MKLAMVGLGRMGGNMARRLLSAGHEVVVYDVDPAAVASLGEVGGVATTGLDDLVAKLEPPRTVWVMLPAGPITQATLDALAAALEPADVIIDGGNARWTDTRAPGWGARCEGDRPRRRRRLRWRLGSRERLRADGRRS